MNDIDLGKAMQRLPRTTASPRFTSNVIRGLHDAPRRPLSWRMAPAVAMMLLLVAGLYAASVRRERQQRIQTLRGERQQIESELRRVKAMANDVQPVVVLENGNTRVIVELTSSRNAKPIYY